jgi:hypothetical protein
MNAKNRRIFLEKSNEKASNGKYKSPVDRMNVNSYNRYMIVIIVYSGDLEQRIRETIERADISMLAGATAKRRIDRYGNASHRKTA